MVDHLVYDSFGQITSQTAPALSADIHVRRDVAGPTSELDYDNARWYNAGNGVFMSPDPWDSPAEKRT